MKNPVPTKQGDQPGAANRHRKTLIFVTVVLVLIPLVLGTLRLAGYL